MIEVLASPAAAPVLGFLVGIVGAIAGVGGGFFVVPFLMLAHGLDPRLASGTSLAVVFVNALSATIANSIRRRVDYRAGLVLAAFTMPGLILGSEVIELVRERLYFIAFGGFLVVTSVYMLLFRSADGGGDDRECHVSMAGAAGVGLVAGFIATMFGVGGGIVHMPYLVYRVKMPARRASATSQFALLWTALFGAAAFALRHYIDWRLFGLLAVGIVAGAQAGVWVMGRVDPRLIKIVLALVTLVVAVQMVLKGVLQISA